jgi:diketogulonate reductase-like aldo/keto reductase
MPRYERPHTWQASQAARQNAGPAYAEVVRAESLVVIPKSTHKQRLQENSAIFDFELTDKDLSELAKLERGFRTSGDPTHMP